MSGARFNNEAVEALFTNLMEHRQAFEERKKGDFWRAAMFGLADCFPDDARAIYSSLQDGKVEAAAPKRLPKVTTGARTRMVRQEQAGGGDCEGCGQKNGHAALVSRPRKPVTVIKVGPRKERREVVEHTPAVYLWQEMLEVDAVMQKFEGRAEAMQAWAQMQGVAIPGNVTRAETVATYIVRWAEEQREQMDSEQ